jgi:hypothetical protein
MELFNSKAVLVCAFLSSVGLMSAATPGIGIAVSEGNILINSSASAGNATIFDGNTLETQTATSQVRLNGGAQLKLASDSRGTVYSDHVDLQKGSANITGYSANANGLNVRADGKASAAISMRDQGVVEIAALTGSVHVYNAAGFNVANLAPGRALDLKPQDAGASAPSSLTGCTRKSGSDTLITDETSSVTVQLRGGNAKGNRRYQVTGSMVPNATPASGATQVLNVTSAKELGACGAGGGAAAGGAAAGGAAAAAGLSTAAIAGIAVAGAAAVAVGATAAAGGFSSSNPPSNNNITP